MEPQRKAIFRYWNGDAWVWADPLDLSRRLDMALGDPDACFADLKSEEPAIWRKALDCLIANVRDVFGMPAIDPETGAGATIEDCRAAANQLWDYLAKKKTTSGTTPSSAPSTTSIPTACPTKPSSV